MNIETLIPNTLIKKALIFISTVIFFRIIFTSCCVDSDYLDFQFNNISTHIFNNSNFSFSENDIVYRNALGIRVEISGEIYESFLSSDFLQITKINAMEECPTLYKPINKIKSIDVIALSDFSDQYKKGTSLNHFFLATEKQRDYLNSSKLYLTLNQLFLKIQEKENYSYPHEEFYLFLKEPSESESLQLLINVILEDNSILRDTTNLISFID